VIRGGPRTSPVTAPGAGDGKYVAVCGRIVPAAEMKAQPGKPCAVSIASVRAQV
jgi:hypothetical protein